MVGTNNNRKVASNGEKEKEGEISNSRFGDCQFSVAKSVYHVALQSLSGGDFAKKSNFCPGAISVLKNIL